MIVRKKTVGKKTRNPPKCKGCGVTGHTFRGCPEKRAINSSTEIPLGSVFIAGNYFAHTTAIQVTETSNNSVVKARVLGNQHQERSGQSWFIKDVFDPNIPEQTFKTFRNRHGNICVSMKKIMSNPTNKGIGISEPVDNQGRIQGYYFSEFWD